MDKRRFFLNNPTSDSFRITELNLSLPPGVSDLFQLNPQLNYEQIDYSMRHGTLRAAMDNKLCLIVPDTIIKSLSNDIIIRQPLAAQVLPGRAKFNIIEENTSVVFDQDDADLFEDMDVKPARQLEEEMNKAADNIQIIEATVKEAKLPEKPIENRYTPPPSNVKPIDIQQKIKDDLKMGYNTCEGITASGSRCMRRAKNKKKFCGLHLKK